MGDQPIGKPAFDAPFDGTENNELSSPSSHYTDAVDLHHESPDLESALESDPIRAFVDTLLVNACKSESTDIVEIEVVDIKMEEVIAAEEVVTVHVELDIFVDHACDSRPIEAFEIALSNTVVEQASAVDAVEPACITDTIDLESVKLIDHIEDESVADVREPIYEEIIASGIAIDELFESTIDPSVDDLCIDAVEAPTDDDTKLDAEETELAEEIPSEIILEDGPVSIDPFNVDNNKLAPQIIAQPLATSPFQTLLAPPPSSSFNADIPLQSMNSASEDDFGDFENIVTDTPFEMSFSPTNPLKLPTQTSQTSVIATVAPSADQIEFTISAKDIARERKRNPKDKDAFKSSLWRIMNVQPSQQPVAPSTVFASKVKQGSEDGVDQYLIVPTDDLMHQEWAKLVVELQTDAAYMNIMTNRFRWRNSYTCQRMDEVLGKSERPRVEPDQLLEEDLKSKMVNPEKGRGGKDESFTHALEMCQMREGMCFAPCGLQEDTLALKTPEELEAIKQSLLSLARSMQEQAGYWLDAKEQLVMDAEMHNKMISSLVGFAQQQQIALSKKAKSKKK